MLAWDPLPELDVEAPARPSGPRVRPPVDADPEAVGDDLAELEAELASKSPLRCRARAA